MIREFLFTSLVLILQVAGCVLSTIIMFLAKDIPVGMFGLFAAILLYWQIMVTWEDLKWTK